MTASRRATNIAVTTRGGANDYKPRGEQITEIFGEHVFNDSVMRQRLPKQIYKTLYCLFVHAVLADHELRARPPGD